MLWTIQEVNIAKVEAGAMVYDKSTINAQARRCVLEIILVAFLSMGGRLQAYMRTEIESKELCS